MIPEAAVAFVADLLRAPRESMDYLVGQWVWPVLGAGSRDEVFESVNTLMRVHGHAEGPQSRAAELAYEIWLLLGGRGVAA